MALAAGYRATNITLTVQQKLGNSITVDAEVVPILYGRWPDPSSMRTPSGTPMKSFVYGKWLDQTAGQKGAHVCTLDVVTLIGSERGGDPQGLRCSRIADAIQGLFTAPTRDRFYVKDFTIPSTPLDTDICLYVRGARGTRGMCYSRTVIPWEDGMNRIQLKYQFQTAVDLSGAGTFDPVY